MEWMDEPDREEFDHAGLKCLILRHPELKHLNGYVALPKGHPCYGKDYDDIDVEVHGGLTFAKEGDGETWERGYWWVGFDCAHWGDLAPQILELLDREPNEFETYRNFAYVRAEVKSLAEQVVTLEFIDWEFTWVWPLLLPPRAARKIWSKRRKDGYSITKLHCDG